MAVGFALGLSLASTSAVLADDCLDSEVIYFSGVSQTFRDTDDGDDEENYWYFGGGNDWARSLACWDPDVRGELNSDDIGGGSGTDTLDGGYGADDLYGGISNTGQFYEDELWAGHGDDYLADVEGPDGDLLFAGNGNDVLDARDGDGDDYLGGEEQEDWCYSNAGDEENSCEH